MTIPFVPRPSYSSEAQTRAPPRSSAWKPGCLGLLRPQTSLILEGRVVPFGLGGSQGEVPANPLLPTSHPVQEDLLPQERLQFVRTVAF